MKSRTASAIPVRLEKAQKRFDDWRSTRRARSPIPESLWASAVKLVDKYGLYRIAKTLRLDYSNLKKRVETAKRNLPVKEKSPTFFELVSNGPVSQPECSIDIENTRGTKLRIHFKATGIQDIVDFAKAFWKVEE